MNSEHSSQLSSTKKTVFSIVAFALPIVLLLLLEALLTLFHYGGPLDLFVQHTTGSHTEYVLNKNVTSRYFFHKGIKTPIPLSQAFPVHKDSSTYRIFCLGASTTQGFPYPPNGGYPAQLQNMLSDVIPEKKIEVLNCGITAVTSFSVLDLQREILRKYQPDLLIIYSGHNEFYGVFGQASTLSLFQNRTLLNVFLKMQRSRVVLLARNTINQIFGKTLQRTRDGQSPTLMRLMANDAGIPLDSKIVQRTRDYYQKNITDMCKLAQKYNTDIMLCTLVDNQRDLPPFASVHDTHFATRDTTAWHANMSQAKTLLNSNNPRDAIAFYEHALEIDSTFAMTHYELAECYEMLEQYNLAKQHYLLAKDYDAIRFRAPSFFNDILSEVSGEYNVPLIDIKSAFENVSPDGLIGHTLLFEHVHPNVRGYTLMAKTMAHAMQKNGLVSDTWNWTLGKTDSAYMAQTQLTVLDHEIVNYTLFRLTSQWPFPASDTARVYEPIGTPRTAELARAFVDQHNKSLVELHLEYGNEFHQNNELDAALAEYQAAQAIQPLALTYNRLGRVYLRKTERLLKDDNDYDAAYEAYRHGVSTFKAGLERWPDDVELNFNLGLLYFMRQDQMDAAIAQFLYVLELEPDHKNAHRQLVELYIRQNELTKAKFLLQQAVARFPDEARFFTDLGVIFLHEKNFEKARTWLTKAIQLNNDPKAVYFLKQLDQANPN